MRTPRPAHPDQKLMFRWFDNLGAPDSPRRVIAELLCVHCETMVPVSEWRMHTLDVNTLGRCAGMRRTQ